MKSIIEEIFSIYLEKESTGGRYHELISKLIEKYGEINKLLNNKHKSLINELDELICEMQYEASLLSYKHGFKAGVLLMIDTLKD